VYRYEPHTWGPKEADALVPPGGWVIPVIHGDVTEAPSTNAAPKA
jgi:hypothetical protein